jgi:lipopolysaccharide/colanic/teichoic acid biosynthesis glycosyltransferase
MSGLTRAVESAPDLAEPDPLAHAAGPRTWERPVAGNTTWPTTRLASWCLSMLLLIAVSAPALAGRVQPSYWFGLVPVAAAIALATRALFRSLCAALPTRRRASGALAALLSALATACVVTGASAFAGFALSPARFGLTVGTSFATLAAAAGLRAAEMRAQSGLRRVYFVGSAACERDLIRELQRCPDRQLVGSWLAGDRAAVPNLAALTADVVRSRATVVTVEGDAMRREGTEEALNTLAAASLSVVRFASFYEAEFKKIPLAELAAVPPLADASHGPLRGLGGITYRGVEILLAGLLLALTLPGLCVAALAIRLTSKGPALYRQRRVGKGGVPFTLLKLRTMTTALHAEAGWAHVHAHRVTSVGRHLRRFRLDELPQLWNVLRGELALIGPRPEQVPIVERLCEQVPSYGVRHCVRPGLTGWAQVNLGYAGSVEGTVAKLQRDLFYVKRRSLRLDALIIWLTLKTVISGNGSAHEPRDRWPAVHDAAEQEAEAPREMHDEEDRR